MPDSGAKRSWRCWHGRDVKTNRWEYSACQAASTERETGANLGGKWPFRILTISLSTDARLVEYPQRFPRIIPRHHALV